MAGLDDLFAEIPVQDIASKLGADQGEVTNAIQTLVPSLLAGLAQNVQSEDIDSSELESAVVKQGASGLLDGGVSVDQVDESEGDQIVAKIFGGNDSNQVASALAGTGIGGGDLIKKLLPILAPIVLAYLGKQFAQRSAARPPRPGPGRAVGRAGRPAGRPSRRWRRCGWRRRPRQHPGQRAWRPARRRDRRCSRRPARRQEVVTPSAKPPHAPRRVGGFRFRRCCLP